MYKMTAEASNEKYKDRLEAKTPNTVVDTDTIPGDGRGACGFDSYFFVLVLKPILMIHCLDPLLNFYSDSESG